MRSILTILIFLLTISVYGQDTTYYDYYYNTVNPIEGYNFYQLLERDKVDTNKVIARVFDKSGQMISETNYNPYYKRERHGKVKRWYKNGQLKQEIDFEYGKLNGELLTYWENGNPKRSDLYINGNFINGVVWNEKGEEIEHHKFRIMPEFPGGFEQFSNYMSQNLKYPKKARQNDIEGRVLVEFIIEKDGGVTDIRIIESVNDDIDAEAIRVIKEMPKWYPGIEDGEKIWVSYRIPVIFKLK